MPAGRRMHAVSTYAYRIPVVLASCQALLQ